MLSMPAFRFAVRASRKNHRTAAVLQTIQVRGLINHDEDTFRRMTLAQQVCKVSAQNCRTILGCDNYGVTLEGFPSQDRSERSSRVLVGFEPTLSSPSDIAEATSLVRGKSLNRHHRAQVGKNHGLAEATPLWLESLGRKREAFSRLEIAQGAMDDASVSSGLNTRGLPTILESATPIVRSTPDCAESLAAHCKSAKQNGETENKEGRPAPRCGCSIVLSS